MPDTRLAPLTLEGWFVLHQGFRVSRPLLKDLSARERDDVAAELIDLVEGWSDLGAEGWSGAYRMVGGGLDVMLLHFRPSLEALADIERSIAATAFGDVAYLETDYVSVVELGLYRVTTETIAELRKEGVDPRSEAGRDRLRAAAEEHRALGYVQSRLHPRQPGEMPYLCFYPMDKRRVPGENWYELPLEERNELMIEHGEIGRLYAGRVSQVISGSVGFDDWEWAVTLFAGDPLAFKELVTEMRYDQVSARYADFGPFFVGRRLDAEGLALEIAGG